jgi:hypothetical protein
MKYLCLFLSIIIVVSASTFRGSSKLNAYKVDRSYLSFSQQGPFTLNYDISIEGGSSNGIISAFLLDHNDFTTFQTGNLWNATIIDDASVLNTANAVIQGAKIEQNIMFHVVVLNENPSNPVTVNYNIDFVVKENKLAGWAIALIGTLDPLFLTALLSLPSSSAYLAYGERFGL